MHSTKEEKIQAQYKILYEILEKNRLCTYGNTHNFSYIRSYDDFARGVPVVTHEDMYMYIERMMKGEDAILTAEKVIYFAQTAGTTTGKSKYLPVTKACLSNNHFSGGKEVIANYITHNPHKPLFPGKSLILGGGFSKNPYTGKENVGYISAILQKESGMIGMIGKEPSLDISFIHDRDIKIDKIMQTCVDKNITSMGGVTSRGLVFLEKLLKKTGKKNILEIRPDFGLYMSGGINFEPYRQRFNQFFPSKNVQFYQVYNASEGFFGIQYNNENTDMLLLTNHGIFYEFIDMDTYFSDSQKIIQLSEVEVNKKYALLITTYGGLYRYEIGDVIQFSDKDLFLFSIVGRTKVYIDVFSEHVIVENTDKALLQTCKKHDVDSLNYHVAPLFADHEGKGTHERVIEFNHLPVNKEQFIEDLDLALQELNGYYAGKRAGNLMLQLPLVHFVLEGTYLKRFQKKGKIGGQHKIPKLANDRNILNELLPLCV